MAESEDVGHMLARLNSMAFLAADAYSNQQHARTQNVQSLYESVFHLDSIRNILSGQHHSHTDLEYLVDIGEDEKLVVYGPDDGENGTPMPLLTTGIMALAVAPKDDANYHAELVPDEIAAIAWGAAMDGEIVSLDELLLAYIFDRIITHAFAGSTADWREVNAVAFKHQHLHTQNVLSLKQRLLRGLSTHISQLELLFSLDTSNIAQRDGGEVTVSAVLRAILPDAVSGGAERLLLWNAVLRVGAATTTSDNTQQAASPLRPRYVDWVHVGDIPSLPPTLSHHNGRARKHFLLLQGSASGLIDDLHAKLQASSSDVQRHDIHSFSPITLLHHGSSRQGSITTATVIVDLASIATADNRPGAPNDLAAPCQELCERLAAGTSGGVRIILVTQGVLSVTGFEDRQVEADSVGAAKLVDLYAGSQQLDVWQVDVDARAPTSEGADALWRLLSLLDDDGSGNSIFKSSHGGIVALRDGVRLFEPAWVESGRVVDAAGDEEVLLRASFASNFQERGQVFEMELLLANACNEALRSVVDPATFERAFAKLDRLAEQSLAAAVASLGQQDLQHSVPVHLKQLCERYSKQQHFVADASRLQAELEKLHTECPPLRPSIALLANVLGRHRDVLLGRLAPLDVLFGKNDAAANSAAAQQAGGAAAEVYDEAVLARVHKSVVESTVSRLCDLASRSGRRLRILEVGAGTGGTALPVLRLLQQRHPGVCAEYAFTDLGAHFVHAFGRRHDAEFAPFLRTQTLDVGRHPSLQGFAAGEYDVVICVNVLHATPSVEATLANVHALLAAGGVLVLQEITTQASAFLDATFGLTEGWWAASPDDAFRPGGYPTLQPRAWQHALGRTGFAWTASTPAGGALDQQAVFVAQKSVPTWVAGDIGAHAGMIAPATRLREESDGWYVLAGEQGDLVTALAAQELVRAFDARRLIWVRFGVGGAAASYAQNEEDRAFQLAHEAGVNLEVCEGMPGNDIITPEVQSLLKNSDVRGVVWVTKDSGAGPQSSTFTALQQLHVDLDRLDRIPRRLVVLHGIGYEGDQPLRDPVESFVRFRRGRLGLPTLLARWHLSEENVLPSAILRSTVATAIRSCDFRSGMVAVLDFISTWQAAGKQQQNIKTIATKASATSRTVSGANKSVKTTNGTTAPTATRESNVPSIDTIIAVVIAEAEALLGSSGSVDADDPLMQAGIDSLAVVELRAGLRRLYPLAPLPSTYIYEFATARAIAEAIATMLAEAEEEQEEERAEAARAAPPPLMTASPAVRDISLPPTVRSPFATTTQGGVGDAAFEDRGNKIAVISMDCRMPGGMNSSDEFWEGLKLGRDAMVDIPLSRFDVDEVYDGDIDALSKGKTYVRRGGFLDRAEHFDQSRFTIPEVQLQQMDPQQRILLETVDSALTDAGYSRKDMVGRDASVYIGVSCKDWAKVAPLDGAFIGTGAAAAIVSNRISFELGLSGTSMSIDTACSSSLVAVDLAVQALRLGRTDMAVAGGVNMILHPDPYVVFCQNKMLSPDGLCKTFDRDAKGYVRSEGCGVVILKRLADALRDGDPVLGVITGSCSNQDGRSTNISAPSGKAQQEVVQRALRDAGRRPDEVDFVELHGTGTALGDPVEVHSLKAVFGAPTTRKRKAAAATDVVRTRPLYLGAVKTNIGHPEAAAGIAGLIKCVNVVQQRQVPPNIHLDNINPGIEFEGFEAAQLPERVEDVGRGPDKAVVAGCSSFGFGGTNVHVIVESPPAQARRRTPKPVKKETKSIPDVDLQYRTRTSDEGKLVIAFTGQGSQFASMAKELYHDDTVFAAAVDRCVDICSQWIAPDDLRNALLKPNADGTEAITPGYASQASLFVMEYAIYQTLMERGLQVDVVLGHSIGEIVAAVVSGCLSLEDGLRLVCQRGIIMEQADVTGTMYAIMLPHTAIQAAIDELGLSETASVAAINGSNLTTVAGLHESLQRLLHQLGQGVTSAPLKVSRPFHSPLLRPCMQEFAQRIDGLEAGMPTAVRFWSTVTAAEVAAAPDVNHWVKHALQAVLFEPTVRAVSEAFAGRVRLLEVGPKSVLCDMMRRWAKVPAGLPTSCALLGLSSVAAKSGITLASLQTAVKANEQHFGKRDDVFEEGEEGECDPSGSNIVLVGQGRRQGFFPWRRGYHALITSPEILQLDAETRAVRFRVNHRTIQLVADHVVRGRPILPGAAVFDLALGGYQVLHNLHPLEALPMELRDAVISRPVVLAADMEPPWLQLNYNNTDGTVQVMSAADPTHEFVEHARATIVRVEPTQRHQRVRLATIQHRCTNAVDVTDLRSKLAARGLAYGPQFQAMVSAHRRRDGECLAELRLPASGSSGYVVHPGVLDSAMQTCAATLSSMAGKDAFAVGSLGYLRVRAFLGEHRSNAVVKVWSRVVSSTPDCYEANVDVCDTQGNVLLSLEALRLVRVSSQVALVASSRCLYLTEWAPLQPAPGQSLCAASSARLPEKTAIEIDQVLGIVTGTSFARRGPVAALRDALRTACGARSLLDVVLPLTTSEKPIHTLLYVCSPTETAYTITSQLCRLFQAIIDTTALSGLRSIVVVTLGSQFVLEDDACSSPESSAAWGLLRSARLELPQLRLVTLDVDPTASAWKQALAVLDAALDASEDEVAWRDGRRYVPRLTDPGFQGTEAEAIDVMRPAFDFSIDTALPAVLDLNTVVPVDVDDGELARVRSGYALVNSLALQSLIQGAASVSAEADVVPVVQQLWRRYRNMPASSVQSELVPPNLNDASAWIDSAIEEYPAVTSELVMLKSLYGQHGSVFRGQRDPLELLFRTDRHTETEGIYSESFYARYYNSVVTYVLSALVLQQPQQRRKLRILEVGAGSGSTTRRMLETAAALEIEVDYHFTDISETFIRKASASGRLAAPGAHVTYGVFDAERDPRLQGLASSSFDLVVAVNVIHATRVLSETMSNIRQLLRPRGVVVLSEFTRPSPMTDASFGMTEGWWRFDDKDLRPEYPLMEAARWESLLLSTGFDRVRTLENPKAGESQAVIVAQASSASAEDQEHHDVRDHEQEERSEKGVYIISGGTGGIGLLTAIVLIERGCRKVYLLSRSGKVSSNSAHLWDRLMAAAQTDQVVKVACDVSNGVQVAEVFAGIRERGEWVEGIIHSAGALRDAMLRNQTPATISTVFAAKVEALRHLHSCSLDEPLLRQFVIYSSCAALLGSPGQSNHAAANAFLDSFTSYRRTCGLPALSIQWGTVSGIGEAARKGANKLAVKFGHGQVSETEAESFLQAIFASDHSRTLSGPMCISPFNWTTFTKMRTRVPSLVSAFSVVQKPSPPRPAGAAPAAKAVPVSNAQRGTTVSLLETIQSCVEATVGTRMPSASSTFFDVGMDSLSAIEFRNRLQSSLGAGVKLSASLVFDYPTLARLQEYLEGLPELMSIANEIEQQPIVPPAPSTVETSPQQQIQSPAPNISCMIRSAPQVMDKVISIVGMDARLPGADTIEDLWNLLLSDEDPFRDIPFSRWDLDDNFYAPKTAAGDGKAAGRSYVRQGSFLRPDQLEWFDNSFFGISNAEARTMDPNQRLLLEVSYQALADAGYTRDSLRGQNVGVFVGFMNYDQFFLTAGGGDKGASAFTASSASPAVLSNRVSHVLGLEGPSCTLDTACSASLYALHTAIGALRSGQCDAAVVAGVNVMMSPAAFVAECAAGMLSASQRCRPLDDSADGFARGEGCVAVVLQRRADAVAQGRYIHADVLGSSIGHDGTTVNLTSPNGPAQARVVQRALQDAGVSPSSIAFVEGHLTGTVLGDPIEFSALKSVFGTPTAQEKRSAPLHLGAIKSKLGHLEGVAGVAGLVKAVLSLRHRVLPPIAHLKTLNRHLDFEGFKANVPGSGSVGLVPSSSSGPELRCGVSSFGFSGANAHIVLEAASTSQRCLVARKRHVFSRNHFPLRRGGSHALLGRLPAGDGTLKTGGEHEVLIGHRLFALLEQHVVRGTPTVPGAMLVELAAAVVAAGSGPSPSAHLQEIVFAAPITVSAPRSKTMSIAHEADGQFTISWAGLDEEDEPHVTAYGRLKGPADSPSPDERSAMLDRLRRHQDACKHAVDISSVWQKLEDVGIRYTGLFRSLQHAYTSIDERAALAYGNISLAENGEDGFLAHPALLDSAMQLCAAVVLAKLSSKTEEEQSRGGARTTFLPFVMTGVRFWAPRPRESRSREFFATSEVVSVGAAEVKARLSVFDDESNPVFDIEEIVFRPAGAAKGDDGQSSQNRPADALHTVCWARMPTAPELEATAQPCVLVVDDEQDRDALASKLPSSVTVTLRTEHKANEGLSRTLYYLPSVSSTAADLCTSALELVNIAVEAATPGTSANPSLWILTHASQVSPVVHPQQAALWGLVRSIVLEDTRAVSVGLVDLVAGNSDGAVSHEEVLKLLGRLKAPSRPISELAWDAGTDTWFTPQMVPDRLCELDVPTMATATTGLDSLEAVPLIEPDGFAELGQEELSIRVGAVGINFHDVLFAAGGLQHGSSALGADFAGTVEAVGSGVEHVAPGDTVFGMAEACMRSVVRCNARLVRKVPDGLSLVDAASLPTVFATAYHCLVELAELQPGQTVLVHTATGGLGHLLINIARSRGAQVVATAGSEEKRAYLCDRLGLGSGMVSTTRDARAFAAQLKHVAGKVDVAINTLSGDYIPETLQLLKPGGKFIETGKVAIWTHDKVAASRPDITYRIVDLDITGSASVDLMDAFLSRLAESVADGSVQPPPVTTFDYPAQLRDAFRYVRTARHIGKVVLRMPSATLPRTMAAANTSPGFSPPEVPVAFDQARYQEGIEQVAQFASRQLRAAAGSLAEHEVDGRWRKLYGRYTHHEAARAETDKDLGIEDIVEAWPEVRPEARLVGLMQGKVEDLFRGRVEAPTLLFSEEAMEVVEAFYVGSLALDYYNTVLKETLASLLRDRPSSRKLRILEVGAGTGATTAKLLPVLESVEFEYVFTDVSSVFLKKAKRDIASRLPANGSMVFDILDIEVDPCAQGFQPAQFDIVLAANCIHATRRMKDTVANMRSLLRPSGAMLLFESTRQSAISDCTFGFTDGWWRFEDFDLRPDYPLLSFETWNNLLMDNGFVSVDRADRLDGALESSAIIVARNNSTTEVCPEDTSTMIREDAAYLVTGGNSGLGLVAARVLIDAGARHVILLSRSGAIKEDDAHLWNQLLSAATTARAKIEHLPCHVGNGAALEQTLASLRARGCPEIRGVIHAAGVLDDAPFRQQSKATLDTVIAPKVTAAISLRQALVPQPDFILLFSSAAGLLGSPTQSNHCAANSTLDALAAKWRHESLPAMSLAWGMVLGLGTLRRQPPGRAAIERLGGISPDLAYRTICAAIAATAGCSHHSGYLLCSPIQWSKLLTSGDGTVDSLDLQSGHRQLFSTYRKNLALRRQLEPTKRKPARKTARSAMSKSTSAPEPTQHAAAVVPDLGSITATIRSILADVTGTTVPSSEPDPRFEDHGVDSLSSMELGNRLNAAFPGLAISPMALNGFPTLSSLSQHVRQELIRNSGGNTTTAAAPHLEEEAAEQQQQNLVDLNDVADDGAADTPVAIVIHGGAGEVHHVKHLAARLPFKVVGVRQTDDVPADSVSSMAAHYIRVLQRASLLGRRADGTRRRRVQLMGYSFGGCVAWEMARLLEMQQQCNQPERLLLLDGGPTTDVSMEHVLGCGLTQSEEEGESVGALSIRLMGALLLASGAKVVDTADIVSTLQRVGLVVKNSSDDESVETQQQQQSSSFDLDLISRTTRDIVDLIPPSLRGAPLQRLTDLFAANMRAYDGYLAFHAAGKAPGFDGPVWVARSKLPRDDDERRRAQLWLDSDHYAFMDRPELAEAVKALVVG